VPIGVPPPTNGGTKAVKSGKVVVKRKVLKTVTRHKDLDYQRKESFRQERQASRDQWTKRFKSETEKLLDKQKKRIINNLKSERTTKALDEFNFDDGSANDDFVSALTPLEFELAGEQGKLAMSFLGGNLPFNITEAVRNQIIQRINRMAANFNTDTKEALVKTMTEAYANNESYADIKKRIERVYEEAKGYRAERIARTEVASATTAASTEAYSQAGVTKIEWFTNPGACEYCDALNGTVIGVEADFVPQGGSIEGVDSNGDPTGNVYQNSYDDISGPPAHPNCECDTIPVRED
jgi:SPP1 gp7 family putative phage head morphogenesis protein